MDIDYDVAQICLNGHIINGAVNRHAYENKDFCEICGQRTTTKCQSCNAPIRGGLATPIQVFTLDPLPCYCHACGAPYPWQEAAQLAAAKLIQGLEDVAQEDKDQVVAGLDDLMSETPKTELAATRFGKLLSKAKSGSAPVVAALRQWSIDYASETTKKLLQDI
jgi:hypothetical protein